jgi:CDP-diacylglycerol--serine O-phosphatidyltransferase
MKHFKLSKVWIPNSFTMGDLLLGFIAIVNASQGQYVVAGFCILFAALLDGFDGQIARMLRAAYRLARFNVSHDSDSLKFILCVI